MVPANSYELVLDSLYELSEAIRLGERISISIAIRNSTSVLGEAYTEEEAVALAFLMLETDSGRLATSISALRTASKHDLGLRIRWDIVLQTLSRKQWIEIRETKPTLEDTAQESESVAPDDDTADEMEMHNTSISLKLQGFDSATRKSLQVGFPSNKAFLMQCFEYIKALAEAGTPTNGDLEGQFARIRKKALATQPLPPLEELAHDLDLNRSEWTILVSVLESTISGNAIDVRTVLGLFCSDPIDRYELQHQFHSEGKLIRSGIIALEGGFRQMRETVSLPPDVAHWLVAGGTKPQVIVQEAKTADIEEFTTNEEYLTAWLDLAQILLEDGDDVSFRSQNQKRKPRTKQLEQPATELPEVQSILRKLLHNATIYPLGQIINKHEFEDNECIVVALAFSMGIRSKQLPIAQAVNIIAGDNLFLRLRYESYFAPNAPLVRSGLVTITPSSIEDSTFSMPRTIVHKIMGNASGGTKSALQHSPFFEHRTPTINLDQVVLPKHIRGTLEIAIASTRNDLAERMRAWGINQITASRSSRSLVLLLSGPPGTGKTYCAEAVAGTLGRDLLIGGAEKILSKWHGQSEHNLQEMFSSYAHLARDCETPPILLLNEADQLLARRESHSDGSTDMTEHRLQNILLENLENFDGMLIATTNLVSSLDEAFSRRFEYKIVFLMPDADARLLIWKAHIPDSVPLNENIDLQTIAHRFSMSGGSIAVACANALRSAVVRGDVLRQEDIIQACVAEEQGGFEHSNPNHKHRSIGFSMQDTVHD